jgi:competence ComEA-like helix-hairpin-helix protein
MKKLKLFGLLLLSVASMIYGYVSPEKVAVKHKESPSITLAGAFKKTGKYKIKNTKTLTLKEVIDDVGVKKNANMKAVNINAHVASEQSIYLPTKHKLMISLNNADAKTLQQLPGVGEKTAAKIIAYRKQHKFAWIEEITNVSGIGEKRFDRYKEYLCL